MTLKLSDGRKPNKKGRCTRQEWRGVRTGSFITLLRELVSLVCHSNTVQKNRKFLQPMENTVIWRVLAWHYINIKTLHNITVSPQETVVGLWSLLFSLIVMKTRHKQEYKWRTTLFTTKKHHKQTKLYADQ